MQALPVPSTAKVWPPREVADSEGKKIDGTDISLYRTGAEIGSEIGFGNNNVGNLIKLWTQWKVRQTERFSPLAAAKETLNAMGFAEGQITGAYQQLSAEGGGASSQIISTDAEGEIGAIIKGSISGKGEWRVGTAGANLKSFPSYPDEEILQGLEEARNISEKNSPECLL